MSGLGAVLLVCTGNTCRSPMAAALLSARLGADWWVDSAGLRAARGTPASQGAILAMGAMGLDLTHHRAKPLEDIALDLFPLIVVMTQEHRWDLLAREPRLGARVFRLADLAGEDSDIGDPYGGDLEAYSQTARRLHGLIEAGFEKIEEIARFF